MPFQRSSQRIPVCTSRAHGPDTRRCHAKLGTDPPTSDARQPGGADRSCPGANHPVRPVDRPNHGRLAGDAARTTSAANSIHRHPSFRRRRSVMAHPRRGSGDDLRQPRSRMSACRPRACPCEAGPNISMPRWADIGPNCRYGARCWPPRQPRRRWILPAITLSARAPRSGAASSASATNRLLAAPAVYRAEINDVLLAALGSGADRVAPRRSGSSRPSTASCWKGTGVSRR